MAETGYGPGGYAYTEASVPAAPSISMHTSESLLVELTGDGNPDYTEYAVYNATGGLWLAADGSGGGSPVWRTRDTWGMITAIGLTPWTLYDFMAKARNSEGAETDFGPAGQCRTHGQGADVLTLPLEVRKASSTIAAPSFMEGLSASIRIAGKTLEDFGFYADTISGLDMPGIVPAEELIPGSHSWRIWDEYFAPKYIALEGFIHGCSVDDLRLRLAYLKSFLATFDGRPWRSTSPVTLERTDLDDRHWLAYYDSIEIVEMLGKRDQSSSARIRISMKCPTPFAESNEVVRTAFTADTSTFRTIDLGNAPSDAFYTITGPSTNPAFTVGDMVFFTDFGDGLAFTGVENTEATGTFAPSANESAAYHTTETGTGILVKDTDTVSYTAIGNPVDGAWIMVIAPQWQSSSQTGDVVVMEHRGDADNMISVYWDGANGRWVFMKRVGGVERSVATGAQAFAAGTTIVLGITYDGTNAGGMKIFVDGVQQGVGGNFDALETAPSTLTLHAGDGTQQPDVVFDLIAGWSRMLSADEMLKIASKPTAVANYNEAFSYSGSLDEGDRLSVGSDLQTATLFDVSEGTRTNVLDAVTGTIPILTPGRRKTASDRTQTVIHVKNAAAQMEVRYRRRYL